MIWQFVYNSFALPIMFLAFYLVGCWNRKIREGIVGRRKVFRNLEKQLTDTRNLARTAWFHFTSVGEFEQAKPIIEAIYPDTRIILTYFSPSVAPNVESYTLVDAAVYLPFDTRRNAERLIHLIQPTCLIFSRYDIWPNLVWQLAKSGIPIIVIACTLHAKSKRLGIIGKSFFRSVYRNISLVCAISGADAERIQQLCSSKVKVVVTGDTRYEQVNKKAVSVESDIELFHGQSTLGRPIFIAGSTYADDEKIILDTYQILHRNVSELLLHLVLVPHEPTRDRIKEISTELEKRNIKYCCYSELSNAANLENMQVIIIDTVGILAKLYKLADIAFVGGSFHGSVHNVMEPAAMAKPVIFGPTIQNAYEASLLMESGAAKLVHTSQQMANVIDEWLSCKEDRINAGQIGKQMIENNLGAVERTLTHLKTFL